MWRVILTIGMSFALCAATQNPKTFRTRLAPVAIDAAMKANVAGSGSVTAILVESKVTIEGKFDGWRAPATAAHIHKSVVTGVRGPAILELTVTKATGGVISGSSDLCPEQIESLEHGRWYAQIDSQKATEGNLWGWLLK